MLLPHASAGLPIGAVRLWDWCCVYVFLFSVNKLLNICSISLFLCLCTTLLTLIFTRGQFCPSGIVVACVLSVCPCLSIRVSTLSMLVLTINCVKARITKFGPEVQDFKERVKPLTNKLIKKGFTINCLKNTMKKCLGKHSWIAKKYKGLAMQSLYWCRKYQ